jgi:inhibitor of cysteine peptidase
LIISKAANGRTFDAVVNDLIVLILDENPTSGYRWQVDIESGIKLVSSEFEPADSNAIGGFGVRTIVLSVKSPGTLRVRAKLRPAWTVDVPAVERCDFTIVAS